MRRDVPKRIVAPRLTKVGGIQIDQVASSREGNMRGDAFRQVAERVDESESISVREVLQRHALKQCGLACARFSDGIDMSKAVLALNPKNALVVSEVNFS